MTTVGVRVKSGLWPKATESSILSWKGLCSMLPAVRSMLKRWLVIERLRNNKRMVRQFSIWAKYCFHLKLTHYYRVEKLRHTRPISDRGVAINLFWRGQKVGSVFRHQRGTEPRMGSAAKPPKSRKLCWKFDWMSKIPHCSDKKIFSVAISEGHVPFVPLPYVTDPNKPHIISATETVSSLYKLSVCAAALCHATVMSTS